MREAMDGIRRRPGGDPVNAGRRGRLGRALLPALALLLGIPAPMAQEKPKGSGSEMSPASRRAFIRDSLRQERLKAARSQQEAAEANPASPSGGSDTADETGPGQAPSGARSGSAAQPPAPESSARAASPADTSAPAAAPRAATQPAADPSENDGIRPAASEKPVPLPISDSLIVESLNVRDTDIRDVLQGLGVQHKVNILMDPEVTGPISVNLHKIKLRDALRLIAEQNGYRLDVSHGAIKVRKRPPPAPPAPPEPKFLVRYANDKLTVDLQKIPVRDAVRRLVEATGRTILVEHGARGDITAFFQDLDLEKALRLLAENNGFLLREKEGVLTFAQEAWQTGPEGGQAGQAGGAGGRMRVYVKDSLVTLEITQARIADVIASIVAQSGISTVVYGNLEGTATMKIVDVRIEQAFQFLFRGTEYTFWVNNGIYFIGPQSMQVVDNSRLIVLKHLKAEEALEALPQSLVKNAQLKLVKSQNAIMVLGTYETIDGISHYVDQIDLPVPQILIEALVVDVDMDKIRNYGVDMFLGDIRKVPSSESIYPEFEQVLNRERSQAILEEVPGLRDIITLPKNFVAKVHALEREKALKIRSRPQISTLNGSEATIKIGQTQYFLLKSETDYTQGDGVTTRTTERFEKIEANVTLTVTPFVTGKGEITCEILPDFSEPEGSFSPGVPPTLNHRTLKSKVRLRDGETIVLGGLVKESENRVSRQVPFLGSIPILGWLFKNNDMVKTRSQLLIFVTPHIYYGSDASVEPAAYIEESADLD